MGSKSHVCPLQQTRTRTRPDQDQTRDRFQGNPAPAPLPALASSGRRAHGATSLLSPADTAPGTGAGTGTGTGTPARCALNHQRSSMSINHRLPFYLVPFRRKRRTKRGGPFILGASLEPFLVFSSQSLVPISKPFCPLINVQVLLKCLIVAPRATPCKSPQALQYHRAEACLFWSGLVLNREVPCHADEQYGRTCSGDLDGDIRKCKAASAKFAGHGMGTKEQRGDTVFLLSRWATDSHCVALTEVIHHFLLRPKIGR